MNTILSGQLNSRYAKISREIFKIAEKGEPVSQFLKECSHILMDIFQCHSLKITTNDIKNDRLIISHCTPEGYSIKLRAASQPKPLDIDSVQTRTLTNDPEELFLNGWLTSTSDLSFPGNGLYIGKGEGKSLLIGNQNQQNHYQLKIETKARLLFPIKYRESCIGLVTLQFLPEHDPAPEQFQFFKNLIQTSATALMYRLSEERQRERVKELQCVYQITKLGAEGDRSIDAILQQAVEFIPHGFYFPEHAACKIVFEDITYTSKDYAAPIHKMVENIVINSKVKGFVKVIYSKSLDEFDNHPFLKEEENLLRAIGEELSSIIQRKRIEEEKQSLQNQLWHVDRLAKIGQLSAGVAHELNEPLSSILGFAQLIQKTPKLPKQADSDLVKIVNASIHAREIVKKLMMFSRQMTPEKTKINFNEQIKDGLYLLESRLRNSCIELQYDLSEDLPLVTLDPAQLNQVLVNLVVNAIQAMEGEGILKIISRRCRDGIQLSIQDNGKGMNSTEKDQAFIPFFTTKDINEGTGLGLSVVHGIVMSHQGEITLESTEGKGTTVHLFFPE